MIKFENVSIKYTSDFYSIYDINLEISENTLILGDKLSGTYALMRILAKIDTFYTGMVSIDNVNIRDIKNKNYDLAYVSKAPYLFKSRSILYNLYYPLHLRKIKKIYIKDEILDIINKFLIKNPNTNKFFGTEKKCNHRNSNQNFNKEYKLKSISKMSESEKKIITLLRALVRKPKYVLIENLFTNLDTNLYSLASDIISEIMKHSTIIASEESDDYLIYKNLKKIKMSFGSLDKN